MTVKDKKETKQTEDKKRKRETRKSTQAGTEKSLDKEKVRQSKITKNSKGRGVKGEIIQETGIQISFSEQFTPISKTEIEKELIKFLREDKKFESELIVIKDKQPLVKAQVGSSVKSYHDEKGILQMVYQIGPQLQIKTITPSSEGKSEVKRRFLEIHAQVDLNNESMLPHIASYMGKSTVKFKTLNSEKTPKKTPSKAEILNDDKLEERNKPNFENPLENISNKEETPNSKKNMSEKKEFSLTPRLGTRHDSEKNQRKNNKERGKKSKEAIFNYNNAYSIVLNEICKGDQEAISLITENREYIREIIETNLTQLKEGAKELVFIDNLIKNINIKAIYDSCRPIWKDPEMEISKEQSEINLKIFQTTQQKFFCVCYTQALSFCICRVIN